MKQWENIVMIRNVTNLVETRYYVYKDMAIHGRYFLLGHFL